MPQSPTASTCPQTCAAYYHLAFFALEGAGSQTTGARLGIYKSLHTLTVAMGLEAEASQLAEIIRCLTAADSAELDFSTQVTKAVTSIPTQKEPCK